MDICKPIDTTDAILKKDQYRFGYNTGVRIRTPDVS